MPVKYLLGPGALLQQSSQREDTAFFRWIDGIGSDEIQTSVVALAIAYARIDHQKEGKERELWMASLQQLENDITVHAGPPLDVDLQVAKEWAGLRYAPLESKAADGSNKSTSQDVRMVIATAMVHRLVLVEDEEEPYHTLVEEWGCEVLVPT